jgi:hypothetical protein
MQIQGPDFRIDIAWNLKKLLFADPDCRVRIAGAGDFPSPKAQPEAAIHRQAA